MSKEKEMEQDEHINKVMDCLNGMERAKAPEYALAGIKQRIANQAKQQHKHLPQPIYTMLGVAATLVLVVIFNVICLTMYFDKHQSETMTDGYSSLVSSFNLYENE